MGLDRFQQVERLYHSALNLTPGRRADFLEEACAGDEELRREVESLLGYHEKAERFIETPAMEVAAKALAGEQGRAAAGRLPPSYRIDGLLGEGGMGKVYRAHDTRLGRTVAIKVGREEFGERFQHEARAIAALNHPHICTLYDAGPDYLVMEYVEGKPVKGPLPLDKVLEYGSQICDALDAAHRKGIVHRDLKPSNILVTRSGVKVLDFGLAKMDGLETVTLTGVVMGTPAYMAPEQRAGKATDARSDIYSLGQVICEMATGERAPSRALEPPALDRVVKTCMAADPADRWQSAREVKLALELAGPSAARAKAPEARRVPVLPWLVAGAAIMASVIALWAPLRKPVDRPFLQMDIEAGPEPFLRPAVSPDGQRIAFVTQNRLVVRRLDQKEGAPLAGTEGATYPFFSPDGQWVGFFASGKLQKIPVEGGATITLCDAPNGRGGSWGEDGNIIAALSSFEGLSRVPSAGGAPQPVTELKGDTSHRFPQVLPDGNGVLFGAWISQTQSAIRVLPPGSGTPKTLVENSLTGRYLASGHLVFYRQSTLFAAPMDLARSELTGQPAPLAAGVTYETGFYRADFDASPSGTLVYRRGNAQTSRTLSWVDASGNVEPLLDKAGAYWNPRFSPDGKRLALTVGEFGNRSMWIYDLARDALTRLTSVREEQLGAVWTPDGEYLAFHSGGTAAWTRSDGTGKMERWRAGDHLVRNISSFSPDGRRLVGTLVNPQRPWEIWTAPLERSGDVMQIGEPEVLLRQPNNLQPGPISPDGRWLAYVSDESGLAEVYVMPFLPKNQARGKWPVSLGDSQAGRDQAAVLGGAFPVWSRNGQDLFFRGAGRRIMVATYRVEGDRFVVGKPRVWSDKPLADLPGPPFDVAPDGKRVVAIFDAESEAKPDPLLRVMMNVGDELRRREAAAGRK
ncbi:MAG: protein kinase domain-containing protein [Bryobacteraceae bacterium]